jgi:hypothetical protein
MAAVFVEQSYVTLVSSKQHQLFAKHVDRQRQFAEFAAQTYRLPTAAQVLAARCAATDTDQFVIEWHLWLSIIASIGLLDPFDFAA